jgi:hypothetical protein
VVSPDVGGVVRARAIAKRLDDADLAIIDKRRPRANVATVMNIIGDVAGKTCVLVDDIVDTAGTLCAAAAALKAHGAKQGRRLLHPSGAVGRGDRQHQRLAARRAGGHRHHPAVPFKPIIMHIDFMRVSAEELLRMSVPIHFVGEELSPAGKASGVVIQHQMTEVEISALPKNLPEFLSVDLSHMEAGDVVMLSDIVLPEGVSIPALTGSGEQHDAAVANAVHVKADQGTGAAAAAEAEAALGDELGEIPEAEAGEEAPEEGEEGGEQES